MSKIQAQIEKGFGLKLLGTDWSYNGNVEKSFSVHMGDPEIAFQVLTALKGKLQFTKVVVIASKPVNIFCNSQSPLCIVTELKVEGVVSLIETITKAGGKQLGEHEGAWLLQLP